MIKRLISLPLAALVLTATAQAETISITPGQWSYEYTAVLFGLPLTDAGSECVAEEDASISLQSGAEDLGNDCVISAINPIPNGYAFTLTCSGDISGEGSGEVVSTGDRLDVTVTGKAGSGGLLAPFTLEGSARRTGGC